MGFDLDPSYKDVPARIADFKAKHPEGSLRPLNPEKPWEIVSVEGQTFVVYCAAAFRTPDDPAPGVGTAWELVPGKTPYTKLSELQNAETSAWGRAIVAVLASESKSVASAEDVRNRQADHQTRDPEPPPLASPEIHQSLRDTLSQLPDEQRALYRAFGTKHRIPAFAKKDAITEQQAEQVLSFFDTLPPAEDYAANGAPFEPVEAS